ncbi:uncharacterized protein N7500_009454 [Penicillium coprophilum]|uniref:uncharacterized protein n=1 Tax=Penicillium coprophilum TaxID=36646 RepID=UPI0023A45F47|nr:uncharacterized protein N7500_009454 [Penicillium coprophilum]KAJ5154015.1 hypothetical protein N7500_009454 [Penicillium coprophilum]
MPTTRLQKKEKGEGLLHGLVEQKRVRKSRSAGSSAASKPARSGGTKKGEGKQQEPDSPHVALANSLLQRGAGFQFTEPPEQVRPSRIIWGPREVPITQQSQLPDGWSVDEPDLNEADVDGQIERCKERIKEGIMPDFFKNRMTTFTAIKQEKMDMISSEPQGLGWEVVQRLDSLKKLERSLGDGDDNEDDLSNVKAIMTAYRSRKLTWDRDSVTYWSNGKLIAGPQKLNMQELYALSAKHGPKGFWVEGIDDCSPGPLYLFFSMNSCYNGLAMHTVYISLRNPTTQATNTMATTMTFDFLEDTGSSTMRIFSDDRFQIETLSGAPLPAVGQAIKQTAAGQIVVQNVILQANIMFNGQPLVPYWVDIQASVTPGRKGTSGDRLSGVWIQHLLFVLSMPDNTQRKHIGTDIGEMILNLPIPDYRNARPPRFV